MGNFLQEFDRSNGYVLFFYLIAYGGLYEEIKTEKKKNDNFWISWRKFGPPQEIIFG